MVLILKQFFIYLALERLRHTTNITSELQDIKKELASNFKACGECHELSENSKNVTIRYLIAAKEYRWQLITAVSLQITQQLSGINAVSIQTEVFKFKK